VDRRYAPAIVVGLALAAALAWFFVAVPWLDSPVRRVSAYLDATAAGDEAAALGIWVLRSPQSKEALLQRRTTLSHDLAALRVGRTYNVRHVDWWRTCCEPGPVPPSQSHGAGLARMLVSAVDGNGRTHELVFEVWVKDITWWGDAGGQGPPRDWTLYEVHGEDESCLFGSRSYGCS